MRSLLTVTILYFSIFGVRAQLHCGADEMHQHLWNTHPDLKEGAMRANQTLQAFTEDYVANPTKSGVLYVIPVVFHIIHNNGSENISDAQVHDALVQLNTQFRKLNGDTSEIVPAFQSIAADAQVEFRLAQLDPNGLCTSGITRTVSALTYIGDHQVKDLIHWPPNKYLNVYVCFDAAGLAGHALLPGAADTIPQWDGIVMRHDYVGTIGTSDYFRRTVLTHEVGHYLNLQHIWGGNNVPNFPYLPVGDAGNCAYDDDVTDTPNTIGWSSCNLSAQSCGSLDNVQNYMDYAYCARMFTEGQKLRMHACLNSPIASRNNLWSAGNLQATGTDGTAILCAAQFEADKRVVCVGDSVNFMDVSYHGVSSRSWNFFGGSANSLNGSQVAVSYNAPGFYDVLLKASNGLDTVELLLNDYIQVLPITGLASGISEGFEDDSTGIWTRWRKRDVGQVYNWEQTNTGFNSDHAIFYDNLGAGEQQVVELVSGPYDFSAVNTLAIRFDWAYAQVRSNDNCILRVQLSADCGETWSTRRVYNGLNSLPTINDTLTSLFEPIDESEWKSDTILVTTSTLLTDNVLLRFYFEGRGGNAIYLDNICISDLSVLSMEQLSNELNLYPNPVSHELTLDLRSSKDLTGTWEVTDQTGRTYHVKGRYEGENLVMDVAHLAPGLYFMKADVNGQVFVSTFVKK